MRFKGLILMLAVLLLAGFLKVNIASGCEGVALGPRITSVIYLRAIADAYGIVQVSSLGEQNFGSPIESLAFFDTPKIFGQIVDEVERELRGRIYNFERIIAEVNYLLDKHKDEIKKQTGVEIKVDEIRPKLEAKLSSRGVYKYVNQFLDALGVSPDDKVGEYTRLGVYPVLQDPRWSGAGDLNRGSMVYEDKTISGNTVKGVITDWMIAMELSGLRIDDIKRVMKKGFARYASDDKEKIKFKDLEGNEITWSIKDAVNHYLGEEFNPRNPEHLRAFMNLCSELYLGQNYVPQDLVIKGLGYLVDNAEAYYMKEFFTTGREFNKEKGRWETVLLKGGNGDKIGNEYYSYWGQRIYLMREVLGLLNKTHYYGRDLSLTDPTDAGLVSSFVDRYYAMIRDLCYNPLGQSWNVSEEKAKEGIRKEALTRLTDYIKIGPELIPVISKAYDIRVDLTARNYEGEYSRRKLSEWSEIAYMLKTYGNMSTDKAVSTVSSIMPVKGKEGEGIGNQRDKILGLIRQYYNTFGWGDMTGFLDKDPKTWEVEDSKLYTGMIYTVCNVLKWKDMFNEGSNFDFDDAVSEVKKMFEISQQAGLPEMVLDYLGADDYHQLPLNDGRYSGKIMFWQQVLYAYYKKTGDLEKAKEYVSYQLKARELIRRELEKGAVRDILGSYQTLTAFEAFENKLEADLSNLQQVLQQAGEVKDKISWRDVPNLAAELATPETLLWPVLTSDASEFKFPEISQEAKSQLGYQPEEDTGFATVVPPQEPEPVATLDVPVL